MDTAGKRGFMCPLHWAMVPKSLQLRHQVAYRAWRKGARAEAMKYARPWETGADCINVVLCLLWAHAFPAAPGCTGSVVQSCPCPLHSQARAVAAVAFERRRYVDTRTLPSGG